MQARKALTRPPRFATLLATALFLLVGCGAPPTPVALPEWPAPPSDDTAVRLGVQGYEPAGWGSKALARALSENDLAVAMGTFRTNYGHAIESQAANIALTARRLAGTVVQPGEEYSMNRALGPYDRAHGYGLGRMFVGDRIVPSIGGGVCQVASTLYNAVMLAHLPVSERHQHGLTVPYLPAGQDATVTVSAGLDFRFVNDEPYPILIWADTLPGRWLRITIWGRATPPALHWEHQVSEEYPVRTVTLSQLPAGLPKDWLGERDADGRRLIAPGQSGVRVHSWAVYEYEVPATGGQARQERIDLGEHVYRASPRMIYAPQVP